MRILFITSNRLGDAILSTGILKYLGDAYPTAKITIAAGPLANPLFEHFPNLERLISFEKKPYGMHWFKLWKKSLSTRWDMVIDVRGSLVSYFLRARNRKVWTPQKNITLHRAEALSNLLSLDHVPSPHVWTAPVHDQTVKNLGVSKKEGQTLIALGMGANWRGKIWPIENFISLAKKMQEDAELFPKCRFVLLGGPDERHFVTKFINAFDQKKVMDLMGKIDLLTVCAVLKNVDIFIGNDSGLMHLAAAAGIPTLGLFGPSRPEHYRPWGPKGAYVTTDVPYHALFSAPDYDSKTTGTLMETLPVEKVLERLKNLWKGD